MKRIELGESLSLVTDIRNNNYYHGLYADGETHQLLLSVTPTANDSKKKLITIENTVTSDGNFKPIQVAKDEFVESIPFYYPTVENTYFPLSSIETDERLSWHLTPEDFGVLSLEKILTDNTYVIDRAGFASYMVNELKEIVAFLDEISMYESSLFRNNALARITSRNINF